MTTQSHPQAHPERIAKLRATFKAKRAQGEVTGAIPLGYMRYWDVEEQVAYIVPDPKTYPLIEEAKRLRAKGMSIRKICKHMNKRHLTSKKDLPLSPTALWRLLRP